MSDQLYYVVSVKHTHRDHLYVTLWRPDNKGYCWRIESAGKYPESMIAQHLGYYHSGCSNIAVKCEVIDAMVVPSQPGYLDFPGMCPPNNRAMWEDILYDLTWPVQYKPEPQYKGARRQKVAA